MSIVKMKEGVVMVGTSHTLFEIIRVARQVYSALDKAVVITSGIDGSHRKDSLHYVGKALDLRTRHLTHDEKNEVRDEMRAKLGDNYDVVLESDHLHVEYDPQ